MKKVFAVFCALILMPSLNAHAWAGGPWSNNNVTTTGDDGVYEAVAVASNGTGIYRWGVLNGALEFNNGSQSSSNLWYYKGVTYFGQCFGIVNSSMGVVSVIGNGTTSNLKTSTTIDADTGTVLTVTIGIFGTAGGNVGFCNSSFSAKFTAKTPVKRFQGKGEVAFTGNMDTELTTTTLTYTTVPSGTSVTETTSSTGGESDDFPDRGKIVSFKVMGSQVSTQTTF